MRSSFVAISSKVAALLLLNLVHQAHAVTSFPDRTTFATTLTSCFERAMTVDIDSGDFVKFDLSQNEWKIFKVFQDADESCDCTIACEDASVRIDMYLTFERRPRLSDNWDGWDCKATLPSNSQTCEVTVPGPDSTCRVAVRGIPSIDHIRSVPSCAKSITWFVEFVWEVYLC